MLWIFFVLLEREHFINYWCYMLPCVITFTMYAGFCPQFKDSKGRCRFFRQEMQRADDEGSNRNSFCFLLWTRVQYIHTQLKLKNGMMIHITSVTHNHFSHVFLCLLTSLQSFEVKNYQSLQELATAFQEINMTELYQQIRPSLNDWRLMWYNAAASTDCWSWKMLHRG